MLGTDWSPSNMKAFQLNVWYRLVTQQYEDIVTQCLIQTGGRVDSHKATTVCVCVSNMSSGVHNSSYHQQSYQCHKACPIYQTSTTQATISILASGRMFFQCVRLTQLKLPSAVTHGINDCPMCQIYTTQAAICSNRMIVQRVYQSTMTESWQLTWQLCCGASVGT